MRPISIRAVSVVLMFRGKLGCCDQHHRAGDQALSFCARSAAQFRLQRRLRYFFNQAEGIEQGHDVDRSVSWRATGPGAPVLQLMKAGDIEFCISRPPTPRR